MVDKGKGVSYQQCAADDDQNATGFVTWLCVESANLVLDFLEWKILWVISIPVFLCSLWGFPLTRSF
jgi:hypothetical protein